MQEDLTIRNLAKKIINDFKYSVKDKTDLLLELNAIQWSNTGTDSTKAEKQKVKSDCKYIFKQIQTIDKELGDELLWDLKS